MDTTTMMRRRNLRVTEQLLGELEAKRFDSALTTQILATPSTFPRLLRACFLAADGQLAEARADIDAGLEHTGPNPNPVVGLIAGMLLFVTDEHPRALALLDEVARSSSPGLARRAREQAAEIPMSTATTPESHAQRIEQAKRFVLEALARYRGPRS